jgi:hypothetical protein
MGSWSWKGKQRNWGILPILEKVNNRKRRVKCVHITDKFWEIKANKLICQVSYRDLPAPKDHRWQSEADGYAKRDEK